MTLALPSCQAAGPVQVTRPPLLRVRARRRSHLGKGCDVASAHRERRSAPRALSACSRSLSSPTCTRTNNDNRRRSDGGGSGRLQLDSLWPTSTAGAPHPPAGGVTAGCNRLCRFRLVLLNDGASAALCARSLASASCRRALASACLWSANAQLLLQQQGRARSGQPRPLGVPADVCWLAHLALARRRSARTAGAISYREKTHVYLRCDRAVSTRHHRPHAATAACRVQCGAGLQQAARPASTG